MIAKNILKLSLFGALICTPHTMYPRSGSIYLNNFTPDPVWYSCSAVGTGIIKPGERIEWTSCPGGYEVSMRVSDREKGLTDNHQQFWDADSETTGDTSYCGWVEFWILRKDPAFGWDGYPDDKKPATFSNRTPKSGQFILTHTGPQIKDGKI